MPRFITDPDRLNLTLSQTGKEYNLRLVQRANTIFTNLMNLLPSNYISTIQGPNYSVELKSVAVELARLELALEDVNSDEDFTKTRTDFLYSLIGYMVFLNNKLPVTQFDDLEFRTFLLNVIKLYFEGAIPPAMLEAVELLFTSGNPTLLENFLLARNPTSGLDISDEFGFQFDISGFPVDMFNQDSNTRLLLDIMRPAHTLFKIRYIFTDKYDPNPTQGHVILDASRGNMSSYCYEDFRVYSRGLLDIDRLGINGNQVIEDEDHSTWSGAQLHGSSTLSASLHYHRVGSTTLNGSSNLTATLTYRRQSIAATLNGSSNLMANLT